MPQARRVGRKRARRRAVTTTRAKVESDIFICNVGPDDYWAYPSPFVAHRAGTRIQFRNLTDHPLEIDMQATPVTPKSLSVAAHGSAIVTVDGNARAGLHGYRASAVLPAPAPPASRGQGALKQPPPKALRYVAVKGGSPPEIIIDT